MGRYVLSIGVVAASNSGSRAAWWVLAVPATLFAAYWDTVRDWGLGHPAHAGLREELLILPPVLGRPCAPPPPHPAYQR